MTNLSPYRLGNVYKYGALRVTVIEEKDERIIVLKEDGKIGNYDKINFRRAVRIEGITLEFLSELAREKGEFMEYWNSFNEGIGIRVPNGDSDGDMTFDKFSFEQDPNESLGEFCLRVATLRKYL